MAALLKNSKLMARRDMEIIASTMTCQASYSWYVVRREIGAKWREEEEKWRDEKSSDDVSPTASAMDRQKE